MFFHAGEGLGKDGKGIAEPVLAAKREVKAGLGHGDAVIDPKDDYAKFKTRMSRVFKSKLSKGRK